MATVTFTVSQKHAYVMVTLNLLVETYVATLKLQFETCVESELESMKHACVIHLWRTLNPRFGVDSSNGQLLLDKLMW